MSNFLSPAMFEPAPELPDHLKMEIDDKVPGKPWRPLTPEELAALEMREPHERMYDPWRCMYDEHSYDVSRRGSAFDGGLPHKGISERGQCKVTIADPTKSRYCRDHARELGVDFYDPQTETEMSVTEGSNSLYSSVGVSIATLLEVMRDPNTPAGVRAKTAEAILDRTGFVKGVKIQAEVKVEDSDLAKEINNRLERLAEVVDIDEARARHTVKGEIVDR